MTNAAPPIPPPAREGRTETTAVEQSVKTFYDSYGWVAGTDGQIGEDKTYRKFRPAYDAYTIGSQQRTAQYVMRNGHLLIAGCGDMPASHVSIAQHFDQVTCIDISEAAIARARAALDRPVETILGSILTMDLPDNRFDSVFCAHVLYHINGDDQERAVRQMLRVTKPGGRVVLLYFNPRSPFRAVGGVVARVRAVTARLGRRPTTDPDPAPALYFKAHPLTWWQRFTDVCHLSFQPWEVVSSRVERLLIWNDGVAALFYKLARLVETRAPALAARLWMFPIVILDKN
jgi:ubiquinone/menaquinone biosynthesis C-methylase UbiE